MSEAKDGKNSDIGRGWIPVVAGALHGPDGRWLMHRRPPEKHHGGLWEFPGGKVDPGEAPVFALVRELKEEIDIAVSPADCIPVAFAEERASGAEEPIVILLYTITFWSGVPKAVEGGRVQWFEGDAVLALEKPPLDDELTRQLLQKG